MNYGKIQGVDKAVSKLVFGCANLGSPISWVVPFHPQKKVNQSLKLLDIAFNEGYNTFDTASFYPGSEYVLGQWIQSRKKRDQIVLITKGGHPTLFTGRSRLNMKALEADLTLSFKRLDPDYIDLYLIHRDDERLDLEALGQMFKKWQESGRVRAFGVSNWSHLRIAQYLKLAKEKGFPLLSASSPQYSMIEWTRPAYAGCVSISGKEGKSAREWYAQHSLAILAWAPLAQGVLVDSKLTANGVFSSLENARRREIAQEIALKKGTTLTQIALSYLLSASKLNVFPVIGCGSSQSIRANCECFGMPLTEEEYTRCEGEI